MTAPMKYPLFVQLLLLGAAVPTQMTLAQSPGTFRATGNMTAARVSHTATLLTDGRVLIAGGFNASNTVVATAEVYDPVSRTFSAISSMTVARASHTATLLQDGRVLIVGGDRSVGVALGITAELYDPSTGTFTASGNLVAAQIAHTATLLQDGRVLIAGGIDDGCCPSISVLPELYDPSTGSFTETGAYAGAGSPFSVSPGPALPTATLLVSGNVLIAGEPTAELYDPVSGTFSLTGAMVTNRDFGGISGVIPTYLNGRTATLLANGKVLLTGGAHEDLGFFNDAEVYDPSTGAFAATGSMSKQRAQHTATMLPDGTVLIAGVFSGTQCCGPIDDPNLVQVLASAELYDPTTGTFSDTGTMTRSRSLHTATLLLDGTVLLAGGYSYYPAPTPSAEIYQPSSRQ